MYYVLSGRHPVPCSDFKKWVKWMSRNNRTVRKTFFDHPQQGRITVSTVFLGLDHNYGFGKPILFETMIFGGDLDQQMWRHYTWEEAEQGHEEACQLVRETLQIKDPSPDLSE